MANKGIERAGFPIAWKIFLGTAGVVIVAMGVSMWMSYDSALTAARTAVDQQVAQAARTASTLLDGQQQALLRGVSTFAENPVFRDVVLHAKPGTLTDQAREAADRAGATWVQITNADGVRLARSDMPAARPDTLSGSPLIGGALEGQPMSAYGISQDTVLFQAVAVPISQPGGGVIGVLMAAKNVADSLAYAVKNVTSGEVVFYVVDSTGNARIAASTLPRGADLSAPIAAHVRARVPADAPLDQRVVTIAGTQYVARDDSVLSAAKHVLGGFIALRTRAMHAAGFTTLRNELFLAAGIGVALALLFSLLLARGITRPLGALVTTARKAAEGDYAAPPVIKSRDEIGVLAHAFSTLLSELRDQQALVQTLQASGETKVVDRNKAEAAANAATVSTSRAITQGSLFAGRYQILSTLGQGGMGVVYKATDTQLGEPIAIKTLRADFLNNDPTALERFRSEIRLARKISHRNVVRTHDIGEADGTYYITMEYIAGTSLYDLIQKKKRLPFAATITIGKQLARALEVAHEQGIIHRDIKPQNLVVQPDGVLKVMDFGIARLTERKQGVTRTGMVVGTPEYMAPEQLLGDDIDVRADLYSAGIVLYECLTGARPWVADSATVLIGKMLSEPPRPPIEIDPTIPASLSALIVRTIARDRNERPASAAELGDALEKLG
jgi:serine/threonine-protein kinase